MDPRLEALESRILSLEEESRTLRAQLSEIDKTVYGMQQLIPHQVKELELAVRGQGKRMDRQDRRLDVLDLEPGNNAKWAWKETLKAIISGVIGAVGIVVMYVLSGGRIVLPPRG